MKKLYFLPYHMKSMSVRELQEVLGGLKIKENGNYAFKTDHLVVNWGHGSCPYWGGSVTNSPNLLNSWSAVSLAVNKLRAFQRFKETEVPTPLWTTSKDKAKEWIDDGKIVFCRTKLSSMEGRGIVVATKPSELVDAPLYTRLFTKDREYRVHVFKGAVIDYVQKKLKTGATEIAGRNKYVRNTANGWIFAREGVTVSDTAKSVAIAACKSLGLDFGAVDLATSPAGKVVVFEVNTAPGIEGTTITKYAEAITQYRNSLQ
jgi:glutathione synthase/RimK-type ligase-like ATP-grasp enzyme